MTDVVIKAPLIKDQLDEQDAFTSHAVGTALLQRANTSTTNVATVSDSQELIAQVCDEIKEMLLEKNRKYGDSALNPTRIFAKSDSVEQIKVRIDDKLNRLKTAQDDEDEDVVLDLMGYLVLLRVAQLKTKDVVTDPVDWEKLLKDLEEQTPQQPWVYPQPQPWQPPYIQPPLQPWDRPYVTWNIYDDGHNTECAAAS